ncbi:MAG: urea transporter [Proteobacteria bacterium]|nr:urea transporter [Pseudomonadota bacterium]
MSLRATLRGLGQVWLLPHAGTGLAVISALAVSSWPAAIGAALGALGATFGARAIRMPSDAIDAGLGGFNGALVGAGTLAAFAISPITLGIVVVGALLAMGLSAIASRGGMRVFTAPFILVYWLILALGHATGLPPATFGPTLALGHVPPLDAIAQVVFATGPLAGALVVVGLAFADRKAALAAIGGATGAWLVALVVPLFPAAAVADGGSGFNAALTAVGLAVTGRSPLIIALGTLGALGLHAGFAAAGLAAATAPFVLVMWGVGALTRPRATR